MSDIVARIDSVIENAEGFNRKQGEHERHDPNRRIGASYVAPATEEGPDLHGFDTGMTAMQKGKAVAALNATIVSGGKVYKKRELVELKVGAGATVVAAKTEDRLMLPDGAYLTSKQLGKIAIDYARFLISKR